MNENLHIMFGAPVGCFLVPNFCEGSINGPKLSEDALKFSGLSEHGLSHISIECLNMGQFRGQAWPSTIYIMLGPLVGWLVSPSVCPS